MIKKLGKQRIFEEHLATLVAESFSDFEDFSDVVHAKDINCYAFSRLLTYPDKSRIIYAPGRIQNLKTGKGPVTGKTEHNLRFIDKCIQNDSIALNQTTQRVSFKDIQENDGNFYFALTDFHLTSVPFKLHWHFICRLPDGTWLHKPNWLQNPELINWLEFGKTFKFEVVTNSPEYGIYALAPGYSMTTCEGRCFEDYFYKLELPED